MNWSGNFREDLAREIRENKTLAKITAYTVCIHVYARAQMFNKSKGNYLPFQQVL